MIAPIQKGGSFGGILDYHFQKVEQGSAEIIETNMLSNNEQHVNKMFTDTVGLKVNRKVKNPVLHVSINLPPGELLNKNQFASLSEEYMKGMGYENSPRITFMHDDTDHQHIHIVASRVDYEGNLISDSHERFKSQTLLRSLEEKYNLQVGTSKSDKVSQELDEKNMLKYQVSNALQKPHRITLPDHVQAAIDSSSKQLSDFQIKQLYSEIPNGMASYDKLKEELKQSNSIKLTDKQILSNHLADAYKSSESKREYLQKLEDQNIYYRELQGKIKYGLPNGKYFSEDKLAKRYQLQSVNLIGGNQDKKLTPYRKESLKNLIDYAVSQSSSIEDLTRELKELETDIKFASNKGGVYGVSFKYKHFNDQWYKGTDIHRDLSWNNLSKNFENKSSLNISSGEYKTTSNVEEDKFTKEESKDGFSESNSSMKAIKEGLSNLEKNLDGDDKEERVLRKRKKRNKGRSL